MATKKSPAAGRGPDFQSLEILFYALGSKGGVVADGDGELDVVPLSELVQPVQELLRLIVAVAADDLGEAVNDRENAHHQNRHRECAP